LLFLEKNIFSRYESSIVIIPGCLKFRIIDYFILKMQKVNMAALYFNRGIKPYGLFPFVNLYNILGLAKFQNKP